MQALKVRPWSLCMYASAFRLSDNLQTSLLCRHLMSTLRQRARKGEGSESPSSTCGQLIVGSDYPSPEALPKYMSGHKLSDMRVIMCKAMTQVCLSLGSSPEVQTALQLKMQSMSDTQVGNFFGCNYARLERYYDEGLEEQMLKVVNALLDLWEQWW